jgi:hypothetical protein
MASFRSALSPPSPLVLRAEGPRFDFDRFRSPHALDRPVPFYSWNERMEPREIRRQIDEMAAAGWGGVFVHSRIGLTTPYLGEEWFAAVDATVEHAKERGLKVWLYDEDKWPSGYSGGSVPLASADFRLKVLIARPVEEPAPAHSEPLGEARDGLQLYLWTAPLGHDWFNGTCYAGLLHREAMAKFLEEAYEPYYRRYSDEFGETIVGAFTDEPNAVFRMRIPEGALAYTPELPGAFRERFGYDPLPKLHLLYLDSPDAAEFRLHYFRVVNQLFERNFTGQLGEWCDRRGIPLTGHFILEDTLYGQQTWGVMIMPNYRHMQIPGVDHLGRHAEHAVTFKQCQSVVNQFGKPRMLSELYGCTGGSLSFLDRYWIAGAQLALGVNLLNPHLSLYTMSGCRKRDYPQNIFYQQPWWPLNREVDDRLSRLCAALQQGSYAADTLLLHPGESVFAAWRSRLDPERFNRLLDWEMDPAAPESARRIGRLDEDFNAAIAALLAAQRGFDLGDETILADDGRVEEGKALLRVGRMCYRIVLMPSMITLAETTLALLENFAGKGGAIWSVGERPSLLDGRPSERLQTFLAGVSSIGLDELRVALERCAPAPLDFPELAEESRRRIYAHVRDLEDGDRIVYLVNTSRLVEEFSARVELRGDWRRVERLDPATGQCVPLVSDAMSQGTGMAVMLPFAPAEDHLLWLRCEGAESTGKPITMVRPVPSETVLLDPDGWKVERLDDNALILDHAVFRRGDDSWSEAAAPVIGLQEYLNSIRYDGPLSLKYVFQVNALSAGRRMKLIVEYPERLEIRVNGQIVTSDRSQFWRDFRWHPASIGEWVVEGKNEIELLYPKFQHGDLTIVEDAFARYGTEIEAIYLVGDFSVQGRFLNGEKESVGNGEASIPHLSQRFHGKGGLSSLWAQFGLPPVRTYRLAGDDLKVTDSARLASGDTVEQGLPFYAGRLRWSRPLPLLGNGEWFLRLENLDCPVAEVFLGGERLGCLSLQPFEVALPGHLCREGNLLEIVFYGTLRNLLGPHHHPEGELCQVGPAEFTALPDSPPREVRDWIFRRAQGEEINGWVDCYSLVSFGAAGGVALVRRQTEPASR